MFTSTVTTLLELSETRTHERYPGASALVAEPTTEAIRKGQTDWQSGTKIQTHSMISPHSVVGAEMV